MRISINPEKCTGCNSCELVCSFAKTHTFNPKKARIKVVPLDYLGFSNPILCLQCKKPKCVEMCPTGALRKTETGAIRVDEEKCDGCQICVDECIMGAINFDDDKGFPMICDLCGGKPMCVEWCPSGALMFTNDKKNRGRKDLMITIKKAKPFLKKWGIPESELDWYKNFT